MLKISMFRLLTPKIYKAINAEKINLNNPSVVLQDDRIPHIIGDRAKLTQTEIQELYAILQKPDEIYLDYTKPKSPSIAYVRNIKNSDECIKVCVKLSKKSKITKENVNYISTAGKVLKINMKPPDFIKIE